MNPIQRMSNMGSTQKRILVGVLILVLLLAGGGGTLLVAHKERKNAAAPSPSPVPTATAAPTASPTPVPTATPTPADPLTGAPTIPAGPVIAVKIDDTANGRPPLALDQADIVYTEQAEGGLTRNVAIFSTNKPTAGYIRSVRTSDPELLEQYGPIVLVATGGGGDSLTTLYSSTLKSRIMDRGDSGFYRVNRETPYNVVLNLANVNPAGAGGVKDMGWVWNGDANVVANYPAATTISTLVGSTRVGFVWDSGLNKYVRTIGGVRQQAASGNPIAATNVIVQFCQVSSHPGDVDVNGNPAQYTHSIGNGTAAVFRNGHRIDGTWSRADANSPTVFKDANGNVIPFNPGNTWIVLASAGAPLSSS